MVANITTLLMFWLTFLSLRVIAQDATMLPTFTTHPKGGVHSSQIMPNLTCAASSPTSTTVTYSWSKDGTVIPGVTASWYVVEIGSDGSGAGEYNCLATNDVGTVASAEAVIQFPVLTSNFFSSSPSAPHSVTAISGQPTILSCGSYTSIPNTLLSWLIYDAVSPLAIDAVQDMAIVGINGELYLQDPAPARLIFECQAQNSVSMPREIIVGYLEVSVDDTTTPPSAPALLSAPQDVIADERQDVFFECIVGGRPLPTVTWTHSNSRTGAVRITQNGATLRVRNVQASDAGTYTCTAAGVGSFSATLSLRVPPSLTTSLLPSLPPVVYGSPISLQCDSQDNAQWQWYLNGFKLEGETNPMLLVSSSVEEDSGAYQCYVSNSVGFDSSVSFVDVITIPASITNNLPNTQLAFRNEPFDITCNADGAPPPSYVWAKESIPLSTGRDFNLSEDGVLRIISVESSSGGNYSCTVKNSIGGREIGRDSRSTVVSVIAPTQLTNQLGEHFQIQVGTTSTLSCDVSSDLLATTSFSWTKDGQPLVFNDRISFVDASVSGDLRLERAEKPDAGVYVCTVTTTYNNLIGPVVKTTPTNLTITDVPVAPVIISVQPSSPTTIQVQWHFPGSSNVLSDYSIEIQEADKADQGWMVASTQSASVTTVANIEDLTPFTEYNVRVVAIYSQGVAEPSFSGVMTATTEADLPSVAPRDIEALAPNNTALRFSWQPPSQPNGEIIDYTLQYRKLRDQNNADYTTISVGSGSALTYVVTGLEPLERYEYRVAAETSAGLGPYSEVQHADTIAVTIVEPQNGPFYQQIWFIVVMVIVVLIVIATVVAIILAIRYSVRQKSTQSYHVRPNSGYFGGGGVVGDGQANEMTDDAFKAYSGRVNKRSAELTMFSTPVDMDTDQESNFVDTHSLPYSTPQLSTSSSTRLVPQGPAPGYINPPTFDEAIKRPRSHSMNSMRSNIEKPPSEYWEDPESKTGLIDEPLSDLEDDVEKRAVMNDYQQHQFAPEHHQMSPRHHEVLRSGRGHIEYDYEDSDSIGKPSYASSEVTDATEYSHLQAMGQAGYSHLETPVSSINHATFV